MTAPIVLGYTQMNFTFQIIIILDSPQIHRVKVVRNIQQPLQTTAGLERGKNESMMGIYQRHRNPPAPISSPPPAQREEGINKVDKTAGDTRHLSGISLSFIHQISFCIVVFSTWRTICRLCVQIRATLSNIETLHTKCS